MPTDQVHDTVVQNVEQSLKSVEQSLNIPALM